MDLRLPAIALATGRVAFGSGMTLAPATFARPWIGRRSRDPRTQVMCRGLGIRDLALGAGALLSLRRADFGRPRWWYAAQSAADATDLVATLAAGDVLTPARRRVVAAVAAGSAAIGAVAAVADVGR